MAAVAAAPHLPLVAGVFLCGFDEVSAAVEVLVVLVQRHVSVLDQHVRQVRLCGGTGGFQENRVAVTMRGGGACL